MAKEIKIDENGEPVQSKLGIIFVTLIIIIIWLAVMCILIKLDIGRFGSTVLRPVFKDVPVINKILPEEGASTTNEYGYKYTTLSDALERIRELEQENAQLKDAAEDNATTITEQIAEISRLKVFESNQTKYEELKKIFDEEVVFNEKAPDIKEYKLWYESVSPENAASIYEKVLLAQQFSAQVQEISDTFAAMKDPKAAAAILEEMTGDMDKVATILWGMPKNKRQAIMAEMDPVYAAKITKIMYPVEE